MALPLAYSLRNVARRPWRTGMTIVGVAVVVFAAVLMIALSRGLARRVDATGEENNLLLISRKGQNVMFSKVMPDEVVDLTSMPNLAHSDSGTPLISPELMHVSDVTVDAASGRKSAPISIRGVEPMAWDVHRSVTVVSGHRPQESFELMVGVMAHVKMGVRPRELISGRTVRFEGRDWTICGTFAAESSLLESEFWVRQEDLLTVMRRRAHSFVVARFKTPADVQAATALFSKSGAIEKHFKGWPERQYYRQFTDVFRWVYWLSVLMVITVTAAGALIGINTMYTAIISRMDEIATLRILGFGKLDITLAILTESAVICLLGATLAAAAGRLIHNVPMTLTQGVFNLSVDGVAIAAALAVGLLIGVLGALIPAIKGLRLSIVEALRYE